jgi:hypothetical protein
MPLTAEQLDNWFTYHAPTEETTPRYAAIREAEAACVHGFNHVNACVDEPAGVGYGNINACARAYAIAIDTNAPDSADKTAAIRCVRIARNAANEAVTKAGGERARLFAIANTELQKARWQANSAIACGGK